MTDKKINIGIMGFGHIGRYIYLLAQKNDKFNIKCISDIGKPEILHYLLNNEPRAKKSYDLDGNYLVSNDYKTRIIHGVEPGDVPWDVFDVDWVIDSTGKYLSKRSLKRHIDSGAKRVVLTNLPTDDIDNVIIDGVNNNKISRDDKIISAGSSTTNALALMLNVLNDEFGIEYANLTSIHSYTSDQPSQDKAGISFRRSRSAAENIIPNDSKSGEFVEKIIPELKGKIISSTLNVPVQFGSLLDLTTVLKSDNVSVDQINSTIDKYVEKFPNLFKSVRDPIVSSDVKGMTESIVFDQMGTLKIKDNMFKTLSWYDNGYNHALRVLDLISNYYRMGL
tara:strand:+ start:1606 stop:2613 length:1008 start_codon:yes stop_codon:yes gene_type:complete